MKKVTYTEELKKQLDLILRTSGELAREVPEKTAEQLLAEIDFVKNLLDEAKERIS